MLWLFDYRFFLLYLNLRKFHVRKFHVKKSEIRNLVMHQNNKSKISYDMINVIFNFDSTQLNQGVRVNIQIIFLEFDSHSSFTLCTQPLISYTRLWIIYDLEILDSLFI